MSTNSPDYSSFTSQFSPEGRIYQVQYAANATLISGTAIGLIGSDGVVLAVENITEPLSEPTSLTFTIDEHIGAVVAGLDTDSRHLVNAARSKANDYKNTYGSPAPLSEIERSVGAYVHSYTQSSAARPFGASMILGAYIPNGPRLSIIEPSGDFQSCFGCAIGKAADEARFEIEDEIDFKNKPIVELVKLAANIIYSVHDKKYDFELELSWIGKETNGRHVLVPPEVRKEAEGYAKEIMQNNISSDSD